MTDNEKLVLAALDAHRFGYAERVLRRLVAAKSYGKRAYHVVTKKPRPHGRPRISDPAGIMRTLLSSYAGNCGMRHWYVHHTSHPKGGGSHE